ncbi:hypothetical protein AB0H63_09215 [Micromonospora echinospora]|uniref:hypothetical protein n=1 Tax=Micromonospora echinospora TaxID=1877 RepID=UPI0033CFBDE4
MSPILLGIGSTTVHCPPVRSKLGIVWRSLARRWLALQAEIDGLDSHLTAVVTDVAPELVALPGVGIDTARQLLTPTFTDFLAALRTT